MKAIEIHVGLNFEALLGDTLLCRPALHTVRTEDAVSRILGWAVPGTEGQMVVAGTLLNKGEVLEQSFVLTGLVQVIEPPPLEYRVCFPIDITYPLMYGIFDEPPSEPPRTYLAERPNGERLEVDGWVHPLRDMLIGTLQRDDQAIHGFCGKLGTGKLRILTTLENDRRYVTYRDI